MSRYQFEALDPESLDEIVPLILQLGGSPRSAHVGYLTWKYVNNPYLTDPMIYVVRSEGRVVGMRGMFGTSWAVPGMGEPQVLPCSTDTMIAPEHRSKSLFTDLTDFALAGLVDRGYRYVINMGATPANHIASILNLGWLKVGSYEPVVRSTRAVGAPGRREATPKTASPLDPLVSRLKRSKWLKNAVRDSRTARRNTFGVSPFVELDQHQERRGADNSLEITSAPRPQTMARVAAHFDNPGRIHHVRDETYFAWRFANPLARDRWFAGRVHRRFFFLRGGSGESYAVFQGAPGRPELRLVDWAGDVATFAELLKTAIALIEPSLLSTWSATLPGVIKTHLAQSGFVTDQRTPQARWQGLLIKALDSAPGAEPALGKQPLLDVNNWDLRMIQSDATV